MRAPAKRASLAVLTLALIAAAPMARAARQDRNDGWQETGEASYYGTAFRGRRTTSGARFNPAAMTAAHSSLPLGTRVRVTDETTGRSVVVTINDRMPPHGVRIIDLSRHAGEELGLIRRGTAWVKVEPVPAGEDDATEVAEAPADEDTLPPVSAVRHGRRHMRPAVRAVSAGLRSSHTGSATLARSSTPHRTAQHRL